MESQNKQFQIWSLSSGQTKRTINLANGAYVHCLKLLNNLIHLAVAGGFSSFGIHIYNINDESLVSTLLGHMSYVYDLVQLNDEILASSNLDNTIRIWNLAKNSTKFTLTGHNSSVFGLKQISSDFLASASTDFTIKIWNITSGELIRNLKGPTGGIYYSIDLINNGQTLVSGSFSGDKTIKMWNWSKEECLATIQTNSPVTTLTVINADFK